MYIDFVRTAILSGNGEFDDVINRKLYHFYIFYIIEKYINFNELQK